MLSTASRPGVRKLVGTFVGVYWSARPAELPECTVKAVEHFRALSKGDEGLARWFRTSWRKPKNPSEVDVESAEAIASLWDVNRRDIDKSAITELGWTIRLWNGDLNGLSASTSLHCGSTFAPVSNSAFLSIGGESTRAIGDSLAIELLRKLVELWEPDRGTAYHSASIEDKTEIASYKRSRWPMLWPKNAIRCGNGYIALPS